MNYLNKVSRNFHDIFDDKVKELDTLLFCGARATGKTYNGGCAYVFYSWMTDPNASWLILRKVKATIRGTVFNAFTSFLHNLGLKEGVHYSVNMTTFTIKHLNKPGFLNEIWFEGVDIPASASSPKIAGIQAPNGTFFNYWLEEATEFRNTDIKEIMDTARKKALFIMSFNPRQKRHPLIKKMLEMVGEDDVNAENLWNKGEGRTLVRLNEDDFYGKCLLHWTTPLTNDFLDPNKKNKIIKEGEKALELLKKGDDRLFNTLRVSHFGLPGEEADKTYTGWTDKLIVSWGSDFLANKIESKQWAIAGFGLSLDIGISNGISLGLNFIFKDLKNDTNFYYRADEYFYSNKENNTNIQTTDFVENVFKRVKHWLFVEYYPFYRLFTNAGYPVPFIYDYAGAGETFKQLLSNLIIYKAGMKVKFIKSHKGSVVERQERSNVLMSSNKYFVNSNCANHLFEIKESTIDQKLYEKSLNNGGNSLRVRKKENDHSLDESEYFLQHYKKVL